MANLVARGRVAKLAASRMNGYVGCEGNGCLSCLFNPFLLLFPTPILLSRL